MATRNIVPRADGEGKLGTTAKKWGEVHAGSVAAGSVTATGAVSAGSVTTTGAVSAAGITTRQNSTAYAVDDVAFSASLPGKMMLVCTTAGTTAATEPDFSGAVIGGTVTDGTVVWTYHKLVQEGNPTGTIISYAGSGALPDGYLLCDGSALSRATYADLFAAIGTTWGDGDETTTFNIPDIEDQFLQGASTTNPVGTHKEAGLPNITGNVAFPSNGNWNKSSASGAFSTNTNADYLTDMHSQANAAHQKQDFDASRSSAIYGASDTVQPPAACVRFLIKYQ